MTDTDASETKHLTPEAVEMLADALECAARVSSASKMICGWMDEAALTLRALSAALETGRKENAELKQECAAAWDKCEERRIAQEAAEAAIRAAFDRLDRRHIANTEHQKAKEILRAFLARHQKETDT